MLILNPYERLVLCLPSGVDFIDTQEPPLYILLSK